MNIIFTTFFPFAPRTRQSPPQMSSFSRLVRWPKEIYHKGWCLAVFFSKKDIGSLFSILSDSSISLSKLCFFHGLNHFLGNRVPACDADRRSSFFNVA